MILRSKLLRAALFAAAISTSVAATASSTVPNYSDLWSNKQEQGWGVNFSQQADTIFATLFIYDQGEVASWYSVTLNLASVSANGSRSYTGTLFKTTGTPFDRPYNPALLKYREVGTMTVEFGDDAHALLNYTIDGAGAVKSIERLTFATNTLVGSYIGGTSDVTYDCRNPGRNGLVTTDAGSFTIKEENNELVMRFPTCTINGQYTQQGQIGKVDGNYGCTTGGTGFIKFTGMRAELGGISGTYTGDDGFGCKFRGNVGGMRNLP